MWRSEAAGEGRGPSEDGTGAETFGGTSSTTEQIFKKEGLEALQKKLNAEVKGLGETLDGGLEDAGGSRPKNTAPEEVDITGELDVKTQRALGAWQKVHGLPETGLPDYLTLEKLGLEPSDVFVRRPPGNRKTRKE